MVTRGCKRCGRTEVPLRELVKNETSKHGHKELCRECDTRGRKERWHAVPKEQRRDFEYQRKYGVSLNDVDEMRKDQDYRCKICGVHEEDAVGKHGGLYVDHCHTTGKVRGLLCHNCNAGLGHYKDDVDLLLAAIQYLRG